MYLRHPEITFLGIKLRKQNKQYSEIYKLFSRAGLLSGVITNVTQRVDQVRGVPAYHLDLPYLEWAA